MRVYFGLKCRLLSWNKKSKKRSWNKFRTKLLRFCSIFAAATAEWTSDCGLSTLSLANKTQNMTCTLVSITCLSPCKHVSLLNVMNSLSQEFVSRFLNVPSWTNWFCSRTKLHYPGPTATDATILLLNSLWHFTLWPIIAISILCNYRGAVKETLLEDLRLLPQSDNSVIVYLFDPMVYRGIQPLQPSVH